MHKELPTPLDSFTSPEQCFVARGFFIIIDFFSIPGPLTDKPGLTIYLLLFLKNDPDKQGKALSSWPCFVHIFITFLVWALCQEIFEKSEWLSRLVFSYAKKGERGLWTLFIYLFLHFVWEDLYIYL